MSKNFLVNLTLHIGDYEKSSNHLIYADSKEKAGIAALKDECHGEPDVIEDGINQSCWDMGEMLYRVHGVKELTEEDAAEYKRITAGVFY